MSSFTVRSVTFEDAAGIAAATMSAWYHGDSHWRQMWHVPLSEVIAANAERLPHSLSTGSTKRFEIAVDTATGEILGHARWLVPDSMEDMWPSARGPQPKDEEEAAKFKQMFEKAEWNPDGRYGHENSPAQNELREKIIAGFGGPYLMLDYLATSPSHAGRGIASLLVASGLEQADQLNMRVIVTAAPAAVGLYRRLGFEAVEEFTKGERMLVKPEGSEFLLDYVMIFMIREPSGGKANEKKDKENLVIDVSS